MFCNNKYPISSNNTEYPLIKYTRMKKDKPSYTHEKFNSTNQINYYTNNKNNFSSCSHNDLFLSNKHDKTFYDIEKNILISSMNKTKHEFCPFNLQNKLFRSQIKKSDDLTQSEKNEMFPFYKNPREKHKLTSNICIDTTTTFITPSNRFFGSTHNPNSTNNKYNHSYYYSLNGTNDGFNKKLNAPLMKTIFNGNFSYFKNSVENLKNNSKSISFKNSNPTLDQKTPKKINILSYDHYDLEKLNYNKNQEEIFFKEAADFIFKKTQKKKSEKKKLFQEIPNNQYFVELIDNITRLVEIKKSNNQTISVENIVNMLKEEILEKKIVPLKIKKKFEKNNFNFLPELKKKGMNFNSKEYYDFVLKNKNFENDLEAFGKKLRKADSLISCITEEVHDIWDNINNNDDTTITKILKEKNVSKEKKEKKNANNLTENSEENQTDSERKRNNREFSDEKSLSGIEKRKLNKRNLNHPHTSNMVKKPIDLLSAGVVENKDFRNTQKNFLKKIDSFLITQSSGFDGVSEDMLKKTLSILDKFGGKNKNKNSIDFIKDNLGMITNHEVCEDNKGDVDYKETKENNLNDSVGSKKNFRETKNKNFNNLKIKEENREENLDENSENNLRINNIVKKNNNFLTSGHSEGKLNKINLKKKKFNLKDLKKVKEVEENNSPKNNITTKNNILIKNQKNTDKTLIDKNNNNDLIISDDKVVIKNNLLQHLNGDIQEKEEVNNPPNFQRNNFLRRNTIKKTTKKFNQNIFDDTKKIKENEIIENKQNEGESLINCEEKELDNENIENTEAYKNMMKDIDIDTAGISSFKNFMMNSNFFKKVVEDSVKNITDDSTPLNINESIIINSGNSNSFKK